MKLRNTVVSSPWTKLILFIISPFFFITQINAQDINADKQSPIEEITVYASQNRQAIRLQVKVRESEINIYDVFNNLNDEKKFDIHCSMEAPIGSLIKKLDCRPQYVREIGADAARNLMAGVQTGSTEGIVAYYNRRLEEKMRELVQESPELLEAISEHYTFKEELTLLRREMFEK